MSTKEPFTIAKGMSLKNKQSGKIHKVIGSRGDGDKWRLTDIPHNELEKRTIWNSYEPYCHKCESVFIAGKCLCAASGEILCARCRKKPILAGHRVCIDCHITQKENYDMKSREDLIKALNKGQITEETIKFVARFIITKDGSDSLMVTKDYNKKAGRSAWPSICRLALLVKRAQEEKFDGKAFSYEAKKDPLLKKYAGTSALLNLGPWDWDTPFQKRKYSMKNQPLPKGHSDLKKAVDDEEKRLDLEYKAKKAELKAKKKSLDDTVLLELMSNVKNLVAETQRLGFNKGVVKSIDDTMVSIRFTNGDAIITISEDK